MNKILKNEFAKKNAAINCGIQKPLPKIENLDSSLKLSNVGGDQFITSSYFIELALFVYSKNSQAA
jgi:hypothetical protein